MTLYLLLTNLRLLLVMVLSWLPLMRVRNKFKTINTAGCSYLKINVYFNFFFVLFQEFGVHLNLWWIQSWHGYKLKIRVTGQLARQPQERLLKVVITLGRNVVILQGDFKLFDYNVFVVDVHFEFNYLQIFLAVKCDRLGFYFSVFDVYFVTA